MSQTVVEPVVELGIPAFEPAAPATTDTSLQNSGRSREGSAVNYTVVPAAPVPARIRVRQLRTMAQRTPNPIMVDGRPT